MDLFKALILGIIQGVTEFIPISSSAHLVIIPKILNWPYWGKSFDVALHLGTFLALLGYFKEDLVKYLKNPDKKLIWILLVSAIPAFIFGGLFDKLIEEKFNELWLISSLMMLFAVFLWISDHFCNKKRNLEEVNFLDGLIIGIAQALALFPGVSRSGITMNAGILRNFKREDAAKFSFLMSLPTIGGAVIYKSLKLLSNKGLNNGKLEIFLVGTLASFLSGYLCIKFLLKYLQTKNFDIFVFYRLIAGILLFIWIFYH
ncbi:MAG: undecaprenyl-diphosphatase UppP [Armatimonadetes bacterium]|nr:undecaprenyl-diphosphatase UppP [Armatimonadota bacterium]